MIEETGNLSSCGAGMEPEGRNELKPCPFCGRDDSTDNPMQEGAVRVRSFASPAGGSACRVECVCGTSGRSGRDYWQAIEAWNTRAPQAGDPSPTQELVAKRAAILKEVRAYATSDEVGSSFWLNALTSRIMEVTK